MSMQTTPRVLFFAWTAKGNDKDKDNHHDTSSSPFYWSGLGISRQWFPHEVTRTQEGQAPVVYIPISFMAPYLNCSLEELRLAYYFYDLSPKGSRVPGGYLPGRMVSRRSWEKSDKLAVPPPTASLSKSEFTAVFPAAPPPPPSTASQAPPAHVPALGGPLSAGESTKSTEAPPAQTLAPLGLSSQPMTPANSDAVGIFGIPVPSKTVDLPRSPAAERIPAVHTAETEWEGALRAVAWKKTRLQQAQDEYNNAVRVEREKFKVYSEARMNLDK